VLKKVSQQQLHRRALRRFRAPRFNVQSTIKARSFHFYSMAPVNGNAISLRTAHGCCSQFTRCGSTSSHADLALCLASRAAWHGGGDASKLCLAEFVAAQVGSSNIRGRHLQTCSIKAPQSRTISRRRRAVLMTMDSSHLKYSVNPTVRQPNEMYLNALSVTLQHSEATF
jgi:hypothetical protein